MTALSTSVLALRGMLEGFLRDLENQRLWRFVLITMLIPLALIAFWPSPVDAQIQGRLASILKSLHANGIPSWFNYQLVEASANVMLFIPPGVVSVLAYSKMRWWQFGILGLATSCCIELGQMLFLQGRYASPLDVVTNTGGAVIGVMLATEGLRSLQARRTLAANP